MPMLADYCRVITTARRRCYAMPLIITRDAMPILMRDAPLMLPPALSCCFLYAI